MANFFPVIIKQKRVLSLILLFSVLVGILLPKSASADDDVNCSPYLFVIPSLGLICLAIKNLASGLFGKIPQFIAVKILIGIGYLLYWVGAIFGNISSLVFDQIVDIFIKDTAGKWAITNQNNSQVAKVFIDGWNITKGWANMIIVLGFIGVALAFILSLDKYKKLLVPLLITALLVNFSIVFVGLMIDASNIIMLSFLRDKTIGSEQMITEIGNAWARINKSPENLPDAAKFAAIAWFFMVMYVSVGTTFLFLTIIYVIRFAMLAILFILSPLAFALRVLPIDAAKKAWSNWWQLFLKWCTAGLIATFFLRLGMDIFNEGIRVVRGPYNARIGLTIPVLAIFIVTITFLLIGLRLAMKASVIANLIMGAVAAIVGAIITGGSSLALKAGSGALKLGGITDRAKNVRNRISDALSSDRNFLGRSANWLRDKTQGAGASATLRQERMQARLKEPTERLKNIRDNSELARVATSGNTPAERAAATNILKERESLNEIGGKQRAQKIGESDQDYAKYVSNHKKSVADKRRKAMDNAIAHDNKLKPSDFAKSDYRFADFDDKAVENTEEVLRRQYKAKVLPFTPESIRKDTVSRVRYQRLRDNLPSMSRSERQKIELDDLTPELLTDRNFTASMVRDFQTADIDHINKIRDNLILQEIKYQIKSTKNNSERNRLRNVLKEIDNLPHI